MTVQETDQVVPLPLGFYPEAGVSGAVLLQSEFSTFLLFNAMKEDAKGTRADAGNAVVEFKGGTTKFGYPNDEALGGHPLYAKGLECYGAFEVINSSWSRQLTEQNRVSFPDMPDDDTTRHFIFTFHDSTCECLADGYTARLDDRPFEVIMAELVKRIGQE
jgi:hypothetical protein